MSQNRSVRANALTPVARLLAAVRRARHAWDRLRSQRPSFADRRAVDDARDQVLAIVAHCRAVESTCQELLASTDWASVLQAPTGANPHGGVDDDAETLRSAPGAS